MSKKLFIVERKEVHIQRVAVEAENEEEARRLVEDDDGCVDLEKPDGSMDLKYIDTIPQNSSYETDLYDAYELTVTGDRLAAARQLYSDILDEDEIEEKCAEMAVVSAERYAADPKNPKNWNKS